MRRRSPCTTNRHKPQAIAAAAAPLPELVSLGQTRELQREAFARATVLERQYEGRDEEMDSVLADSQDQRAKIAEASEKLFAIEKAEASHGADALSLQIQHILGQIDTLKAQLFQARDHEPGLETPPGMLPMGPTRTGKNLLRRLRNGDLRTGYGYRRWCIQKETTGLFGNGSHLYEGEEGGSGVTSKEVVDNVNYRKSTIAKLKQSVTEAGFGAEILQTRNPSKKDLEIYGRLMLHQPAAH